MIITTRTEFLRALNDWISHPDISYLGELTVAKFLHRYFSTMVTKEYGLGLSIVQFMPQHIAEAMEIFRITEEPIVKRLREEYLQELGDADFPSLTDISFGGAGRVLAIIMVARLMEKVTQWEGTGNRIEAYLFAQDHVLDHALQNFNRKVYREGLWKITNECRTSGMSGQFGETQLRTFDSAGRIMLTFVRKREGYPHGEESITFIADGSDESGIRTGVQSCYTELDGALSMINEVIKNWPSTKDEQQKIYSSDIKVSIR